MRWPAGLLAAADLRPLTRTIEAPTLIVCGTEDIPSFLDAARALETDIPKARLVWLDDARHASILEQPTRFATAAKAFLLGR